MSPPDWATSRQPWPKHISQAPAPPSTRPLLLRAFGGGSPDRAQDLPAGLGRGWEPETFCFRVYTTPCPCCLCPLTPEQRVARQTCSPNCPCELSKPVGPSALRTAPGGTQAAVCSQGLSHSRIPFSTGEPVTFPKREAVSWSSEEPRFPPARGKPPFPLPFPFCQEEFTVLSEEGAEWSCEIPKRSQFSVPSG